MAQWYKVYWQSSTGQQKTTMTSNPNRAQRKIMGTGGRVYKVVQPYAGRKYPKAEKPIVAREPIPTKTRGPIARKEGFVQQHKGDELSYLLEYAEPGQSARLKRVVTGEDEELRSKIKGIDIVEEKRKTALFFTRKKHLPIIKRAKTLYEEGKPERAEETMQQIFIQFDPFKRITQSVFQDAAEDAYGSLTKPEKHEYGFLFTDWKDIASEQRKFHYGGMKHLKSLSKEEQRALGKEYFEKETKKGLGDFDITEFSTKMAGGVYKYGGSKKVWKEKSYEYMWEKMSTPPGKLKDS